MNVEHRRVLRWPREVFVEKAFKLSVGRTDRPLLHRGLNVDIEWVVLVDVNQTLLFELLPERLAHIVVALSALSGQLF